MYWKVLERKRLWLTLKYYFATSLEVLKKNQNFSFRITNFRA